MKIFENFHTPIFTGKNYTILSSKNFKEIQGDIPTKQQILDHLKSQTIHIKNGGEFNSIKSFRSEESFNKLIKEIKKKIPNAIIGESIDLYTDTRQLPLIQVLKK